MGLAERIKEKGRQAIFKRIVKEARKTGSVDLADAVIVDLTGESQSSGAWKEIATGFLGGQLSPDEVYVFQMVNEEILHWFFYPAAKLTALPSEHHALIQGTIPASASLQLGSGTRGALNWHSDHIQFAQTLNEDPLLMKRCQKVSFGWQGVGVRVNHDRPLQIRNCGDGQVHVALRGGMYGFFNDKSGFSVLVDICRLLSPHVDERGHGSAEPFPEPFAFSPAFLAGRRFNKQVKSSCDPT